MRPEFDPWVGKIPWKNKWQPTPVFWPGKSHGQGAWWIVVHGISQSWTWLKWRSTHCIFTYTNFLLLSLFCNYFLLVDTVLCPVLFFFSCYITALGVIYFHPQTQWITIRTSLIIDESRGWLKISSLCSLIWAYAWACHQVIFAGQSQSCVGWGSCSPALGLSSRRPAWACICDGGKIPRERASRSRI